LAQLNIFGALAVGVQADNNGKQGIPHYLSFVTFGSEVAGNRESWDQEGEMADEIKLEIWADYI